MLKSNTKTTVKTLASTVDIHNSFKGKADYIKKLFKKINLKSLTHAYENFFLYDLESMIKQTFLTELKKDFSIYGLISFSGETKKK